MQRWAHQCSASTGGTAASAVGLWSELTTQTQGDKEPVKKIEVFGPICDNCRRVEANAREALAMAGVEAEIVKVTDYRAIASRGILRTPALAIDGKLVALGRIPSAGDIAVWLTQEAET